MAVSGSWISYRKFVVLCLVLTILLLSTNIFLSFDDDETFFDEGGEVIQSWSVDAVGIKETEDKIFNFLEVDENWNERYSEEEVYYDSIDHTLKNLRKPAAYAAKYKLPIIIWWTSFTHGNDIKRCKLGECYFTEARKFKTHPRTQAFLFYGTYFTPTDLPLPRLGHHEWGLFHEESPKNNPLLHHDTTIELFNHTATFRRSSDYPLITQMLSSIPELLKKPRFDIHEKSTYDLASVVYVQSGCNPPSDRDEFVAELMKFIKIDSYGACLHNKDLPEAFKSPLTMDDDGFHDIIAKYKFTLAFENAICEDYITEKLWRPLVLGSVPIYKGSPSIQDWMPNNHTIINVDDFKSPKDLANFIKKLDKNDKEYAKYLEFKDQGITNERLLSFMENRLWGTSYEEQNYVTGFECFVCDRIHENLKRKAAGQVENKYFASQEHYGCPRPEKYNFAHSSNHDSDGQRDLWWQEYDQSVRDSQKLNHHVKSNWYF